MKTNKIDIQGLNPIYKELAGNIGIENMMKLYSSYKGTQIFFPGGLYSSEYIHERMREEYDGTNAKRLAQKYGCSIRTVWRIVKKEPPKDD